jgi:hypothetical protein
MQYKVKSPKRILTILRLTLLVIEESSVTNAFDKKIVNRIILQSFENNM